MSAESTTRRIDRPTVVVIAIVVLLAGAYIAALLLAKDLYVSNDPASAFSAADDGLKIYFDYLGKLGYEPQVLRSFDELPEDATIVFASEAPPPQRATNAERARLASWVEAGGRLVLAGQHADDILGRTGFGGSVTQRGDAKARLRPLLPSVYADGVTEVVLGSGRLLTDTPGWATLLKDLDGQGLVTASVGEGEVVWLADTFPMTNAGIGEADNARLATLLAAAGAEGDGERRLYFDEYHHGYIAGGGILDRLGSGGRVGLLLAALAIVLALLAYGRRIGPPVPEAARTEARGTGYIASLAGLYRKAGARAAALEELEEGLRRALARRHGTLASGLARHPEARDALEASRALREPVPAAGRDAGPGLDAFLKAAGAIRRARQEVEGTDD